MNVFLLLNLLHVKYLICRKMAFLWQFRMSKKLYVMAKSMRRAFFSERQLEKSCFACSTSESYDLRKIKSYFKENKSLGSLASYSLGTLPKDASHVLHLKVNDDSRHIFIFRRLGSFVCWNVQQPEIGDLRNILLKHELSPFSPFDIDEGTEQMEFLPTQGKSAIREGTIHLSAAVSAENQVLEKLAFSNALALSVKLDMWEIALGKFSTSLRYIPEQLKQKKKISISRNEVMQKLGELLSLRHQINLYSDLLATPDFYWDREKLEDIYTKMYNYLEISKRTMIMNTKMDLCTELVEMLRCQLNEQHSHRLEWLIIVLILMEVVFEVMRFVT